ncbi:hypothetical protein CLAIMM_06100 [Cladophialophora immunda]|nr:hypothetical protein CLAIMM_06100 [Cladophialophora immunda]
MAAVTVLTILFAAATVQAGNVATPLNVPFNLTHYFGYDGPWHAIPVLVSDPQQLVNLYPGGTYATCIPSINVRNYGLNYTSDNFPNEAGIFDLALAEPWVYGSSQNYAISGPGEGGTVAAVDGSLNGGRPSGLAGEGLIVSDSLSWGDGIPTVLNASISAVFNASYTLPNGIKYPLDVGFLSLGASNNQFFGPYVANMVPLNLSATGVVPSNTWGMHIGSVYPNVPGSLILGGYDRNRVIGTVSMWPAQNTMFDMIINLLDVSIGVETGASPFPFAYRSGLLVDGGQTAPLLMVRPNPTVPYLYLPDDTCKAIASHLPVTYIESLDLYAWDTTSSDYQKVVTSPTYLAFTFQTSGSPGNMTVKVPFALLNLTLTPPLVDNPTQYFPCKSYLPLGPSYSPGNEYHLGRAFLQAAFIGMNWHQDIWWMAQAPGPTRLAPYETPLLNSTTTIQSAGDSSLWADSWSDVLTPLPALDENSTSSSATRNSKSGGTHGTGALSAGAKAGIGVGASLGGLTILGTIALFIIPELRKRNRLPGSQTGIADPFPPQQKPIRRGFYSGNWRNKWEWHELESKSAIFGKQSPFSTYVLREQISELPERTQSYCK